MCQNFSGNGYEKWDIRRDKYSNAQKHLEAKIRLLENSLQVFQLQGGRPYEKGLSKGGNKTSTYENMVKKGQTRNQGK